MYKKISIRLIKNDKNIYDRNIVFDFVTLMLFTPSVTIHQIGLQTSTFQKIIEILNKLVKTCVYTKFSSILSIWSVLVFQPPIIDKTKNITWNN